MSTTHASLLPYLLRKSAFVAPGYEPDPTNIQILTEETRILVVGAGGLGCEILKNLALTYCNDIHVIDMDTIDVSNLNRQFLFRLPDCGRYKADVAAERIMQRYSHVKVKAHNKPLQSFNHSFYQQFDLVIAGLDNVEARQWLNQTLVNLVKYDAEGNIDPSTIIPFIDGGTEGFSGQARAFLPRITSCFECSLPSMPAQVSFPTCTIRNVPRLPEHCILYALKVEWPLLVSFNSHDKFELYEKTSEDDAHVPSGVTLDKDDVEHMRWLYERAAARATTFGITGVTYALTQQVVKNIIPAIASTNALIAAVCCNEVWKIRTNASLRLDNYFMYMGGQPTGTHSETFTYQRNPNCSVCQTPSRFEVNSDVTHTFTLQQFIDELTKQHKLDRPSVSLNGQALYIQTLHADYIDQLDTPISVVIQPGAIVTVNDKAGHTLQVMVLYK